MIFQLDFFLFRAGQIVQSFEKGGARRTWCFATVSFIPGRGCLCMGLEASLSRRCE